MHLISVFKQEDIMQKSNTQWSWYKVLIRAQTILKKGFPDMKTVGLLRLNSFVLVFIFPFAYLFTIKWSFGIKVILLSPASSDRPTYTYLLWAPKSFFFFVLLINYTSICMKESISSQIIVLVRQYSNTFYMVSPAL